MEKVNKKQVLSATKHNEVRLNEDKLGKIERLFHALTNSGKRFFREAAR